MAKSLEEIKKLWRSETDEWVRIAATQNLNDYPPQVQEIIRAEATRRISSKKDPDHKSDTPENEPFRLSAKTQIKIGFICACFILLNETYNLVNGQLSGSSSTELSAYLIKIVIMSVYVTALVKRKVPVVQFMYSFWLWIVGCESALIIMVVLSDKRTLGLQNPATKLFSLAVVIIPYLMGIYVLKTGLRGLRKLIKKQEVISSQ
jgi:hypothetical protein